MENQFILSLILSIFVGGAAGYLGSLMITKRMALVGDALSHVALPGMGLALLYGINVFWGALVFLFLGILLIWFLERKTDLSTEALTGIIFTVSLALGFLITPEPELLHALVGDISQTSLFDALTAILLSVAIFLVIRKIMPGMILGVISEDLAKTSGINVKKQSLIYLFCLAFIVALGVRVVGSLLMGALVIIPAAVSKNLSKTLIKFSYGAMITGALSCFLGVVVSQISAIPAGPAVILVCALFFLISVFLKRE